MNARYNDSFYMSRTIYIINTPAGRHRCQRRAAHGQQAGDVGRKGLKKLVDLVPIPKRNVLTVPAGNTAISIPAPVCSIWASMPSKPKIPYPVKAYIAYRHDPLMGFPDPDRIKQKWSKLGFLMSVSFT